MTDKARAYVRTVWPMLLGHLVAWVVAGLAPFGLVVDSAVAFEALGFVSAVLVYVAGYELERFPGPSRAAQVARSAGRFLISLGLPIGRPEYPSAK